MFKVQDQATEAALCAGIVAAVVWGIGLSVYGFQQPSEQLSWIAWGAQLIAGILGCLTVPLLFVRGREWVLARLRAPQELQEQR